MTRQSEVIVRLGHDDPLAALHCIREFGESFQRAANTAVVNGMRDFVALRERFQEILDEEARRQEWYQGVRINGRPRVLKFMGEPVLMRAKVWIEEISEEDR